MRLTAQVFRAFAPLLLVAFVGITLYLTGNLHASMRVEAFHNVLYNYSY
jgi:hypothetical protein